MKNLFICLFIGCTFVAKSQTTVSDSVTVRVVDELKNEDIQLSLFPDVTATNSTLKIHMNRLQYLIVDLTDLDGNVIRTVASQQFNNSDQSIRIETYGLSGGSYFISVKAEGGLVLATKLLRITRN